ncbi:hypothetical protein [Rhodopseudomonas sp.]|uniref:hypothetical protein n=1 Tax=Rhodopseudomonas sp. TaxID=1078 RepID=UPI003B3BACF7
MAIDLGRYAWLAQTAIDFGLPILGTALGIPGPVSDFAISKIKSALGLKSGATPEDVSNAVAANPDVAKEQLSAAESEVAAKYAYLIRLAEVQADVAKTQVEQVNESIRAEAATPNGWWGHWRTWMAYELAIECPFWAALIVWCIVAGKINELVGATSLLTVWWGARFGVLGVHVWTGSIERQTAIAGQPVGGAASTIAAAVTGKRK